jgi:hypothetical protein
MFEEDVGSKIPWGSEALLNIKVLLELANVREIFLSYLGNLYVSKRRASLPVHGNSKESKTELT